MNKPVRNRPVRNVKQNRVTRRQKALRRRRMIVAAAAVILLAAIVAIVCAVTGVFEKRAQKSTLTLQEDGSVVFEEVAAFDGEHYDKGELKSYAREQIEAYNTENGKGKVKLERVAVKDGVSYMRVRYASAEDYQKFTGYEIFAGTIAKAQEAGYTFQDSFAAVKDKEKGETASVEDVISDTKAKTLILRENVTVQVDGTLLYVSEESTTVEGKSTLTIAQVDGNQDATSLTYIIYK